MRDFRKIIAYQLADELVLEVYRITKSFPKNELYGLTSQLRRAAVSGAANIIEGANRKTLKEYLNFLWIAKGSISESGYYLGLAERLGYIEYDDHLIVHTLYEATIKTLTGLIQAVESQTASPNKSLV